MLVLSQWRLAEGTAGEGMQRKQQVEALALASASTALLTCGDGLLKGVGRPRLSVVMTGQSGRRCGSRACWSAASASDEEPHHRAAAGAGLVAIRTGPAARCLAPDGQRAGTRAR